MLNYFNLLEIGDIEHTLTEEKIVLKFKAGWKEDKAIRCSIHSKSN